MLSHVILVSDTSMIAPDVPSITTGLRGLAYWEVEMVGPNVIYIPVFSKVPVAKSINVLCKMIGDMIDDKGHITIPGFYDDVLEVSADEQAKNGQSPFNLEAYQKSFEYKSRTWRRRILYQRADRYSSHIRCMWYLGEVIPEKGQKTVLPSVPCKISCRLVPNQKHDKIAKLFQEYFESIAPEYVKVKVSYLHGGPCMFVR